nr:hypothetical protein [Dysgonomonas sp. PH5-37]
MSFDVFRSIVDEHKKFEVQFEGGEPTIHPEFIRMVSYCLNHQECGRVVIQSNGIERALLERCLIEKDFYTKLVFKISFNEYLYKLGVPKSVDYKIKNSHLFNLLLLKQNIQFVPNVKLIINARTTENDNNDVKKLLGNNGLIDNAVVYKIQKYGRSKEGVKPFIKQNIEDWKIFASDGKCFEQDLISRSEYEQRKRLTL